MKHTLIPSLFCASSILAAAGTAPIESAPIDMPPPSGGWEFRLEPYAWLTAIDGTSGPQGFPATIDAGFGDVFDVLEKAAALQFEARKGKWGFMADVFYAELGQSGTLPGAVETGVDVDFEQFIGEFVVFHRISEAPMSFVDLYAGGRHNSIAVDLEVTSGGTLLPVVGTQRSGDKGWTDPIIGARSQWEINDRWYIAAKGDIGGFGVASDFTWNAQASVGYRFSEALSLEVGYRYFDTDYTSGRFVYDVAQAGALIGLNYEF